MSKAFVCIAIGLILFNCAPAFCEQSTDPQSWTGNANLFFGTKILDKADWEPLDKQVEGGILLDVRHKRLPISIAVDFLYSMDDDEIDIVDLGVGAYSVKVESRIIEFDLGLRKIWERSKYLRPFLGGGVAIINGQLKTDTLGRSTSDDETTYGPWLNAGLYVTLSKHFNIGIDGRWSRAEVDLYGVNTKVGGWHIGILTGWHW